MTVSYVQRLVTPVLKQFWQDVLELNDLLRREECPCALAVTTYVSLLSNHNFSYHPSDTQNFQVAHRFL